MLRICRFCILSLCYHRVQTISHYFRSPRTSPPLGSYSTRFFGCFQPMLSIVVEPFPFGAWLLIVQSLRLSHYGTQGSKEFPAIHEVFNPLAICYFVATFAISTFMRLSAFYGSYYIARISEKKQRLHNPTDNYFNGLFIHWF